MSDEEDGVIDARKVASEVPYLGELVGMHAMAESHGGPVAVYVVVSVPWLDWLALIDEARVRAPDTIEGING